MTQPDLKAELRRRPQWGDGGGLSVWDALPRAVSSKAITGDNDVFFGEFGVGLIIGIWGSAADVVINPFSRGQFAQVDIAVNLWCNFAIRSPRLFGLMDVQYLHRIAARKAEEKKEPAKSESEPEPEKGNAKKK